MNAFAPDAPDGTWPDPVVGRIRAASCVLVLTGAGMSAESGIATFRDAQTGLWARFRPEDLATPEAFARDPGRVWRWYAERRAQAAAAEPHAGHRAVAELARRLPRVEVVTQNVDGLHQRAGSDGVLELHGSIMRTVCASTRRAIDDQWLAEQKEIPPPSPHRSGALARPDVVWFGEALPERALEAAFEAASRADVCLSVGTSSLVQPAAQLPLVARESGALLVEVNPEATPLSPAAHLCVRASAGRALPALLDRL